MMKRVMAAPFRAVYAPVELRNTIIRIRDGALVYGTANPTAKTNPAAAPTVAATGGGSTGGNLQAGTYYLKYTDVNSTGETLASPETLQFTVVAGNIPEVTLPSLPGGVTSRNIYLTPTNGISNSETLYVTGVTGTTYDIQAPFVLGGVAPPALNTTGVYAIGTTTMLIAGLTTSLTNGLQFTVGGDRTTYRILSHSETLSVTTSVTFTPALVKAAASAETITFGPHILAIKVGDGNLTYSDKNAMVYVKDRGNLDSVRRGDEEPVDLKFEFTWEFLTAISGSGIPTIEDALKRRGEASAWVTTSTDPCEPYCVDVEIEYIPPCASVQREIISFTTFRWEEMSHDIKNSQISVSGKANIKEPTVTRAA